MNAGDIHTQDTVNIQNNDQGKTHRLDKQLMLVQSKIQHSAWLDIIYGQCDINYWKWTKETIQSETMRWPGHQNTGMNVPKQRDGASYDSLKIVLNTSL